MGKKKIKKEEKSLLKSNNKVIENSIKKLKKISKESDNFNTMFLSKVGVAASSFVSGTARGIHNLLQRACEQDESFAMIVKNVAKIISSSDIYRKEGKSLENSIVNDNVKDFVQDKNVEEVKLQDGSTALSINADKISELTDEEIDEIVDKMINRGGLDPSDD